MKNTMISEWIKLRTIVAHWVLVAIAIAFPVIVTLLGALFGDWFEGGLSADIASLVTGLAIVTAMLLGAVTATSLTSEYNHNTIRPTFAATPSRIRVHASKLVVLAVAVFVAAAVAVLASWFVAQVVLAFRDRSISLGEDGAFADLVSVVVLSVIVTIFAYALGLLIRNAPATITILLLWPLIIENLLLGLFTVTNADAVNKWLPYSAAITAVVADGTDGQEDILGRPWGLVWFAFVSLVLLGFGLLAEHRRDA